MSETALLERVRARQWFYEFELPDGTRTRSALPAGVEAIHTTRLAMLDAVLDPTQPEVLVYAPDADGAGAFDFPDGGSRLRPRRCPSEPSRRRS